MWTCSHCGNQNKDEYRFCLNCGEPQAEQDEKPKPKKAKNAAGKDRRDRILTAMLLIFALLLVVVIAALIVNYQKLNDSVPSPVQTTHSSAPRSGSASSQTGKETGGSSVYVFGTESAAPAASTPSAAVITPKPTASPAPSAAATDAPRTESEYLLPDSASRYLTEDDLKDLSWKDCCLARNEIFARHGRIFSTPEISAYFRAKSWYHGTVSAESFSETVFNEYEASNVNLIKQYEISRWGGSYY